MKRRYGIIGPNDRLFTTRLFATRLTGKDGWHLQESLSGAQEFHDELVGQGLSVEEIVEVETFEICWGRDEDFEPGQYFNHDAYELGWGFDAEAQCWRAPHEYDLRFPGEPERVERLSVSFDPPEVGWLDTAFTAGAQKFEFSLSEQDDTVALILKWLEQLVEGKFDCVQMSMERGWYMEFHCVPCNDKVRFVIEYGDWDRKRALDVEIYVSDLILGVYSGFMNLWESEEFGKSYWEWGFDYIEPPFDFSGEREDLKDIRPKPIRSALIDNYLRAAGKDW